MLRIISAVLCFVVVAIATENAGAPELVSHFIASEYLKDLNSNTNRILSNGHLHEFYQNYYSRPQDEQALRIRKANKHVRKMSHKALEHRYPYADQFSEDPNKIASIVNYQESQKLFNTDSRYGKDITDLINNRTTFKEEQESKLNNVKHNKTFELAANKIFDQVRTQTNNFNELNEHSYSSPFGDNSRLSKIIDTVRDYEHQVKRPLAPLAPNPEEINALNRLSEKMAEISKRIHQKPLENLHQDAHAQDLMMDRLSNLIRRMSNAVSDDHQESFLQQLHMMLHAHHLHDHRFMSSLESEIAYAIEHGQALPMPRDYQQSPVQAQVQAQPQAQTQVPTQTSQISGQILKTKAQDVSNPLNLNYENNMAAQQASNMQSFRHGQQPMYSNMWGTKYTPISISAPVANKPSTVQTIQPTAQPLSSAQSTSDPNQAVQVAQEMRQYGKTLIDRSKEMKHRADIIERRETIPSQERQDLMNHIQNRLVNPPAQVHPMGAQRPLFSELP